MRKQDITIGAEVAYGSGPRDASWSIPVRVIVTSVDTTTGTTRVGIKPYPGESQYVPAYTRPANIWRLWAEQEEINAARAKADERKRAERVERQAKAGVGMIDDLGIVTYPDERFFSYRRTTHRSEPDYGRHVHAIVLDPNA